MRTSKREQSLFREFERCHGLLASHCREVFEELSERISSPEKSIKFFTGTRVPVKTGAPP
jgi:hypothetical protein